MTCESPKAVASVSPRTLSVLILWNSAMTLAWMLVVWPKPHANLWVEESFGFMIMPPAPTLPGFPLATPSKNREGRV